MTEDCAVCKFYRPFSAKAERGECRRHPPVLRDKGIEGVFPVIHESNWCGEFATRPEHG